MNLILTNEKIWCVKLIITGGSNQETLCALRGIKTNNENILFKTPSELNLGPGENMWYLKLYKTRCENPCMQKSSKCE